MSGKVLLAVVVCLHLAIEAVNCGVLADRVSISITTDWTCTEQLNRLGSQILQTIRR